MSKKVLISILLIIVLIAGIYYFKKHPNTPHGVLGTTITPSSQPVEAVGTPIGPRSKTADCAINGALQDTNCTPGAIIPTATKDQICVAGYSKSVRNVPASEKDQVYAEYNITSHITGQYEVDHLVSLELGGSNDIANLWPEPANPTPGFHQKDGAENMLHAEVCNGTLSLQQAQQQIASNWLAVYQFGH